MQSIILLKLSIPPSKYSESQILFLELNNQKRHPNGFENASNRHQRYTLKKWS